MGEFNKLELEFLLNYVRFELYVQSDTFASYYEDLVRYSGVNEETDDKWIEYWKIFGLLTKNSSSICRKCLKKFIIGDIAKLNAQRGNL